MVDLWADYGEATACSPVTYRSPSGPDCECRDGGVTPRRSKKTAPRSRVVAGAWLVRALRLDADVAQKVSGQQVRIEDEAWWALRSLMGARQKGRVARLKVASGRATMPRTMEHADPTKLRLHSKGPRARVDADAPDENGEWSELSDPCACSTEVGPASALSLRLSRFVDATNGDDVNDGTLRLQGTSASGFTLALHPWRSLRRVETWLNTDVYDDAGGEGTDTPCVRHAAVFLRRDRTWNGLGATGEEEPVFDPRDDLDLSDDSWDDAPATRFSWEDPVGSGSVYNAVVTIQDFKATEEAPLIISAYGPVGDDPLIDGRSDTTFASSPPQYGDDRVGIALVNCCHVHVSDLQIRGFGIGIDVRGGSRHHVYSNLKIYDTSVYGVRIGVTDEDAGYDEDAFEAEYGDASEEDKQSAIDEIILAVVVAGLYPEDIAILDSTFQSIGYDTKAGDISLSFLATNCTISGNTLTGPDDDGGSSRGIDGVVAQGASSGHLIENNSISRHNKYCYDSETKKAVFVDDTSGAYCSTRRASTWVLLQPCDSVVRTCIPTDLGYSVLYRSTTPSGSATDYPDAFGEDGVDLKHVYRRTPTSDPYTVVRGNHIWGHNVTRRTGITINDGTQGVHIYNNRIYLNAIGILVANSPNSGWWYQNQPTQNIAIYRNLIYMNQERGVSIESAEEDSVAYEVEEVFLINNTIAHNLLGGVVIANDSATLYLSQVHLYNNIIVRNGVLGDYSGEDLDSMQVAWPNTVYWETTTDFGSDYNLFLGWMLDATDKVIKGRSSDTVTTDTKSVSGVRSAGWLMETHGLQAGSLDALYFADYDALVLIEATSGGLSTYIDTYDLSDREIVEADLGAFDYRVLDLAGMAASVDVGWSATASVTDIYHFDSGDDVALSPDADSRPVSDGEPDIGAYEWAEVTPPPASRWTDRRHI